jgi:hypothetical protein
MLRFLDSMGKSLILYFPMLFCVYMPVLYAINLLFLSPLTNDKAVTVIMAIVMIVVSFFLFLVTIFLWKVLLRIFWAKPPKSLAPQSFRGILTHWLIAVICLTIAMLFEPKLWESSILLKSEYSDYLRRITTDTLGKISGLWIGITTIAYFILSNKKTAKQ